MLEALDNFLAIADQQLAREAAKQFKKLGMDIRTGAKVTGAAVRLNFNTAKLHFFGGNDGRR